MKTRPWYRRFPDNFIAGTASLSLEEKGAYSLVLDLIYARGGPIADEPRYIAGVCNCSVRKWTAIRARLIALGKLVAGDGSLWNERAMAELGEAAKAAEKLAENGAKGGNKSAQMKAAAKKNKDLGQAPLKHDNMQDTRTPIVPKGTRPLDARYGDESDPLFADFKVNVWAKRWPRNGQSPKPAFKAYAKLSEADRQAVRSSIGAWAARIVTDAAEERFRPMLATWLNRRGWEADAGQASAGAGPDWAAWVEAFKRSGEWNATALGPQPGQPGCRVPREILVGLAAAAA